MFSFPHETNLSFSIKENLSVKILKSLTCLATTSGFKKKKNY